MREREHERERERQREGERDDGKSLLGKKYGSVIIRLCGVAQPLEFMRNLDAKYEERSGSLMHFCNYANPVACRQVLHSLLSNRFRFHYVLVLISGKYPPRVILAAARRERVCSFYIVVFLEEQCTRTRSSAASRPVTWRAAIGRGATSRARMLAFAR